MAFAQGSAQTIHATTVAASDHLTPTQPTTPVVTISTDAGATFGAPTNSATTTAYGISLALTAAETAHAAVAVRVTSANCDPVVAWYYFEDQWTPAKAAYLDSAVSGIPALVWAYTTRTLTSLSALTSSIASAVWAYATRTFTSLGGLVGEVTTSALTAALDSEVDVTRAYGDTSSLLLTVTSAGAAYDLTGCTVYLSITDRPHVKPGGETVALSSAVGGGITVNADPTTGTATVALTDAQAAKLTPAARYYTLKLKLADTTRATISRGKWTTLEATDPTV